jgi:hypothetical protein
MFASRVWNGCGVQVAEHLLLRLLHHGRYITLCNVRSPAPKPVRVRNGDDARGVG